MLGRLHKRHGIRMVLAQSVSSGSVDDVPETMDEGVGRRAVANTTVFESFRKSRLKFSIGAHLCEQGSEKLSETLSTALSHQCDCGILLSKMAASAHVATSTRDSEGLDNSTQYIGSVEVRKYHMV